MVSNRRAPNLRLRALLVEADWTQEALARAVNALAAQRGSHTHYDRTSVAHWLSGAQPRFPAPELICLALSRRLGCPITPALAGLRHAVGGADPADGTPWADPAAQLAELAAAEVDPVRRSAARTVVFRLSPDLPRWSPPGDAQGDAPGDGPAEGAARPEGGEADGYAFELHAMREMTRLCTFHIDAFGGGHVRIVLAAYLGENVARWVRHRGADRRELLTAAARLTHLLALAVGDMGAEGQAQRHHQTALRLAAEARDRAMYVLSVRALSTQATRVGHTALALRLAEYAVEAGRREESPAVMAYLLAQYAVSLAQEGRSRQAAAVLARAERRLERAPGGSDPFASYAVADFAYQRAITFATLGDHTAALDCFHRSLRERSPDRRRPQAITRARLAELHCARGRLDEACAHWNLFLDESAHLHSHQAGLRVGRMRQQLQPYRRNRAARALLARARAAATPPEH